MKFQNDPKRVCTNCFIWCRSQKQGYEQLSFAKRSLLWCRSFNPSLHGIFNQRILTRGGGKNAPWLIPKKNLREHPSCCAIWCPTKFFRKIGFELKTSLWCHGHIFEKWFQFCDVVTSGSRVINGPSSSGPNPKI